MTQVFLRGEMTVALTRCCGPSAATKVRRDCNERKFQAGCACIARLVRALLQHGRKARVAVFAKAL